MSSINHLELSEREYSLPKRENIHLLLLIIRNLYKHNSTEVACVFAGIDGREKPYMTISSDTNMGSYGIVHHQKYKIKIDDTVVAMCRRAKEHFDKYIGVRPMYKRPIVTIFHNHDRGSSFTSNDIFAFFKHSCIDETFIDCEDLLVMTKIDQSNGEDIAELYKSGEAKELFDNLRNAYNEKVLDMTIDQFYSDVSKDNFIQMDEHKKDFDSATSLLGFEILNDVIRDFSKSNSKSVQVLLQRVKGVGEEGTKYCEFMSRP